MSNTTEKDRHLRCFFGILNLGGLMEVKDYKDNEEISYSEIQFPLFSHESYKIKTTFNRNYNPEYGDIHLPIISSSQRQKHVLNEFDGKYYQKKFRREVLWDFGDGTKKEGFSVEHSYAKPGRYKITCTFFDINRKSWLNDYCVYVVVKEVMPTILRFDENYSKTNITCSKIERIARVEALNSNTIDGGLTVNAKRIFSDEEYTNNYEQIGKDYLSMDNNPFKFVDKYWSFLENKQTLFYNSNSVHSDYLIPTETFVPKYNEIYGKFFYNEITKQMDLSLYQIIPYKNIDENLNTITLLDPNSSILSNTEEIYKNFTITHITHENLLPDDVFSIGKRGWFDIFYKNDFVDSDDSENTFSIFYEIETVNITGELDSASNYLNINPLGFSVKVTHNKLFNTDVINIEEDEDDNEGIETVSESITNNVKIGVSLDGFLRPLDGEDISLENYFIDQHLYNALYKGLDLDIYVFPYIVYGEDASFEIGKNSYYIPKDVKLNISYNLKSVGGTPVEAGSIVNPNEYIISDFPWVWVIPFILGNYFNVELIVTAQIGEDSDAVNLCSFNIIKKSLRHYDDITIPKELTTKQDVNKLLDVYMSHPMFDETHNLKDMMKAYLSNDYLTDILSKSDNFLDNNLNVKRCYLSNLISMLQMMGEDVTLYENSNFEGINDLKNFVRLLSMNHTELVGHVVNKKYDIKIGIGNKGRNVGEKISIDDELKIRNEIKNDVYGRKDPQYISDNLGKIYKVKFAEDDSEALVKYESGVDLIVQDKYTKETKIVSFTGMQIALGEKVKESVKICDYEEFWGWNLLLPESFYTIKNKIKKKQDKVDSLNNQLKQMMSEVTESGVRVYSKSKLNVIQQEIDSLNIEINDLKTSTKKLIDGYYSFYLFNPETETKRIGNFIDEDYITSRIESVTDWNEMWGITHEILMKILIENAYLGNNREYAEYEGTFEPTTLIINKNFEAKSDIECKIIVGGSSSDTYTPMGTLTINGDILNIGENILYVTISNGNIDNSDTFFMDKSEFICNFDIDENRNILSSSTQIYNIFGEKINGIIQLKLDGTLEKPTLKAYCELNYDTPIVTGNINENYDILGQVYENSTLSTRYDIIGSVNVSGEITGTGHNNLNVKLNDDVKLIELEETVDDDGNTVYKIVENSEVENCKISLPNETENPMYISVLDTGQIVATQANFALKCDNWIDRKQEIVGILTVISTADSTVQRPMMYSQAEMTISEKLFYLPDEIKFNSFISYLSNKLTVNVIQDNISEEQSIHYNINDFNALFTLQENTNEYKGNITFNISCSSNNVNFNTKEISISDVTFSVDEKTGEATKINGTCELNFDDLIGSFNYELYGNVRLGTFNISIEENSPLYAVNYDPFAFNKDYSIEELTSSDDNELINIDQFGIQKIKFRTNDNFYDNVYKIGETIIGEPKDLYLYVDFLTVNELMDDDGNLTGELEEIVKASLSTEVVNVTQTKIGITCQLIDGKYDTTVTNSFVDSETLHFDIIPPLSDEVDYSLTGSFDVKWNVENGGYDIYNVNIEYKAPKVIIYSGNQNLDINIKPEMYADSIKLSASLRCYGAGVVPADATSGQTYTGDLSIYHDIFVQNDADTIGDGNGELLRQAEPEGQSEEEEEIETEDETEMPIEEPDTNINITFDMDGVLIGDNLLQFIDDTSLYKLGTDWEYKLTGTLYATNDESNVKKVTFDCKDTPLTISANNIKIGDINKTFEWNSDLNQTDIIGNVIISSNETVYKGKPTTLNFNSAVKFFADSSVHSSHNGQFDVTFDKVFYVDDTDGKDGKLIEDIEIPINHTYSTDVYDYSLSGNLLLSGGFNYNDDSLTINATDITKVRSVVLSKEYNWSDFNSDLQNVTGGFTVKGSGDDVIENITVAIADTQVEDNSLVFEWNNEVFSNFNVDGNGDFEEVEFDVKGTKVTELKDYELSGEFVMESSNGNFIITANELNLNIVYKDIYVLFDVNGDLEDCRLNGLENGTELFMYCPYITEFDYELGALTNGTNMFRGCTSLTSFNSKLSSLTDGGSMFSNCIKLTSFNSDLSSMTEGSFMFGNCYDLTTFTSDLPKLTNGKQMFMHCAALESFNSDLPSLTSGNQMFYYCAKLTSFNSDLSQLTVGDGMFENCILDESSVKNIADTINDLASQNKSGRIDLGINSSVVDDADVVNSITTIAERGWNVYVNGELFELPKPYVEFNSDGDVVSYDLSGIKDGSYMFSYTTLASFNSDLSKLTSGGGMFSYCSALESFNGDLSKLTSGGNMFRSTKLTTFDSDLSSLIHGSKMFQYCTALASFNSNLSSLTDGERMFDGCSKLTTFNSNLSSLTDGERMFQYCSSLESFDSDLSSLTNGRYMFYRSALESFNGDLSSLTKGSSMFQYCSSLESFNSDLSSLTYGNSMFKYCKLDTASVKNIASTINNLSDDTDNGSIGWGEIYIGIQASLEGTTEINNALSTIQSKGWTVTAQYNA